MPRRSAKARISRRGADFDPESPFVRWAITWGEVICDVPLLTEQDWAALWETLGKDSLDDFIAKHPGMRPTAMRLAGMLAPRQYVSDARPTNCRQTTVRDGSGKLVTHPTTSSSYLVCEADQLLAEGVICKREHTKHFASGCHETCCFGQRMKPASRGRQRKATKAVPA